MSSSLAWLMPFVEEEKSITVGTWRAISAASCSGPEGSAWSVPDTAWQARRAAAIRSGVERDRLDPPERLPLDRAASRPPRPRRRACATRPASRRARRRRGGAGRAAARSRPAIAVTTPGCSRRSPIVDTPPWRTARIAHREREARGGEERVAPVRHRRRAGVRGLAAEDHAVALDADGAEHRADRQADGPRAPGPARCAARGRRARRAAGARDAECAVERRRRARATTSSRRLPSASVRSRTASGSSVPAGRGGAEEAAAEARALLVGPVDERDRARRRALPRRSSAAPRARPSRRARRRASRRSAPSRCASRSTTVSGRVAGEARPEVAGLVDVDLDRQLGEPLAQQPARRSPTRPSSTAAARRPGRRSGRRARAGRRWRAPAGRRSPRGLRRAKRGMMCSP